jgi:PiT family inorganic phosphate transporter
VSTTHAIVGAVAGFGVASVGWPAIQAKSLLIVSTSWVFSPIAGAVIALLVFTVVRRTILESRTPVRALKRVGPFLVVPVVVILVLSMVYKGLSNLDLDLPFAQPP